MIYTKDIENYINNKDKIFNYYIAMRENPEELKNLYKEFPFFFTCLWFYLKDINETPDFYYDCGLTVYNEMEYSPLSRYMFAYATNFLGIKVGKVYDINCHYYLTDDEKEKCDDFYWYTLKKDIDKLNDMLKCFRTYTRYDEDEYYLLQIDQYFISYIITPILSGNYNEFFENLYKQTLMRYQLGGKK